MSKKDNEQRIDALINYDSDNEFILKIVEELNELSVATIHCYNKKISVDDLAIEIADVEFQIEKLKHLYRYKNINEKVLIHKNKIYEHIDKLTGRLLDV